MGINRAALPPHPHRRAPSAAAGGAHVRQGAAGQVGSCACLLLSWAGPGWLAIVCLMPATWLKRCCAHPQPLQPTAVSVTPPPPCSAARWAVHRRRWQWWPWCPQTSSSTRLGALGQAASLASLSLVWFCCKWRASNHSALCWHPLVQPWCPCLAVYRYAPPIILHLPPLQRQAGRGGGGARPVPQPGGRPPHAAVCVPGVQRR